MLREGISQIFETTTMSDVIKMSESKQSNNLKKTHKCDSLFFVVCQSWRTINISLQTSPRNSECSSKMSYKKVVIFHGLIDFEPNRSYPEEFTKLG
jgi:hypothetical protein